MATLSFDIFWRDHGAERGLKNLSQHASRAHGSVKTLGASGSIMAKLGGGFAMLGKLGAASAAALGASAVAAVGWGVKVAAGNESARIGFIKMLGSAKEADKMIKDLQHFAARTPFEFPGLQKMASRFIGAGFAAKDIIPTLRSVGDAVAAVGGGEEEIGRATTALIQMKLAGKITMQDLNQLTQAGIDVFSLLAQETGKSKQEVVDLARAGKLTGKDLDAIFTGLANGGLKRVRGAMDEQSKSLRGMFSTMKDVIGLGLGKMIQPLLPQIKSVMGMITGMFENVVKFADRNASSFKKLFGAVITILKGFGAVIKDVFGAFNDSLGDSKITFKEFVDFIDRHKHDIIGLFAAGTVTAIAFGIALANVASVGAKAFAYLMRVQANLFAMTVMGAEMMLVAFDKAFGWIPGIGPKITAARRSFEGFTSGVIDKMNGMADGAESFARGLDQKLIPALKAAGVKAAELGKLEFDKNFQDQSKKAAKAIDSIGKAAGDNKGKIDDLGAAMKGSSKQAKALRDAVEESQDKLGDQLVAARKAGAGQDTLNKLWKTGRDRLADELEQLGLSKKEAGRWANKIADAAAEQSGMNRAVNKGNGSLSDQLTAMSGSRSQGEKLARQYRNTHDAVGRLGAKTDQSKTSHDRQTGAMGKTRGEAGRLRGSYITTAGSTQILTDKTKNGRLALVGASGQMVRTAGNAGRLRDAINRIKSHSVTLNFFSNALSLARKLGIKLARGGPVTGPGGGTDDQVPAWLSNGEYVITAKQAAKHRKLLDLINSGQETAIGDPVGIKRPRFARGGIVDIKVGDIPRPAVSLPGALSSWWNTLRTKVRNSIFGKTVARMKDLVSKLFTSMLGGVGGTIAAGRGWAAIYATARRFGARSFTTYAGHDQGPSRSRDIWGNLSWAMANALLRLNSVWYVIYQNRIGSVTYGRTWRPYTRSNAHYGHIHVTLRPGFTKGGPFGKGGRYATGGLAAVGGPELALLGEGGGGPERVLSARQTRSFDRLVKNLDRGGGGGGGNTYITVNAPNYVGSRDELVRALVDANRRGQLEVIKKR